MKATEYDAGGVLMPRGVWGYGIRQDKSVQPKPPAVFSRTWLHRGTTNSVALLLAGDRLVKATPAGLIDDGLRRLQLQAPPVHDGLIGARGRIYAALRNGTVVCLE